MNNYIYIYMRHGIQLVTPSPEIAISRRTEESTIYCIDEKGVKSILVI